MDKASGGGLILAGILIIIVGVFIQSNIFEWLLDIVGVLIIVVGAVVGVVGLFKLFSGGRDSGAGY